MLSWSIEQTNAHVELKAVTDRSVDPLLPGGIELLDFVDAVLAGRGIEAARGAVVSRLGEEAAVDAAAVTGNFEMMNRIADGVGMPVGAGTRRRMAAVITDLGLDTFPHA